ncbi:MAG: YqgE/AlgH family protein [Sphingobacteriia bacterium]|nr:YqgE/AlgH family protein [Sphingobacteriia bacterium]
MDLKLTGQLLISDPFLKDPNFARTVVLICEHDEAGSIGFVLNKLYDRKLHDLITDINRTDIPVFFGGPVHENTLHFLHTRNDLINDGIEITNGIFWGGNFEQALTHIHNNTISKNDIRFYIGYSGWSDGQLEGELKEKSWIIRLSSKQLVFHKYPSQIWRDSLKDLGGEYAQMVHYPIDPQLN